MTDSGGSNFDRLLEPDHSVTQIPWEFLSRNTRKNTCLWISPASATTPKSYDSRHNSKNWGSRGFTMQKRLGLMVNPCGQNRCVTPRLMGESGTSLGCATLRTSSPSQDRFGPKRFAGGGGRLHGISGKRYEIKVIDRQIQVRYSFFLTILLVIDDRCEGQMLMEERGSYPHSHLWNLLEIPNYIIHQKNISIYYTHTCIYTYTYIYNYIYMIICIYILIL